VCRTDLHLVEGDLDVHRRHTDPGHEIVGRVDALGETHWAKGAPGSNSANASLRALAPGSTLAVAGIWLSDIPPLNHADTLFQERRLRSVTANTRKDGEAFLRLASSG
jgi:D-arabinose 1-dehydrogenase-like Zn-dependent alcohol dehydrogenase